MGPAVMCGYVGQGTWVGLDIPWEAGERDVGLRDVLAWRPYR